jgi:hypothetical protein
LSVGILFRSGREASSPQRGCAQRWHSFLLPKYQPVNCAGQGRLCGDWISIFFIHFSPFTFYIYSFAGQGRLCGDWYYFFLLLLGFSGPLLISMRTSAAR